MPPKKREQLTINALVSVGVAMSLGLIAISAALNFRFAYRMADTEVDAWLYGLSIAVADVIKAMMPFVMGWAWRKRSVLTFAGGFIFFATATAFSFTSATGYAAQHRLTKQVVSGDSNDSRRDLRAAYGRVQARLTKLGPQRSPLEVEKALEGVLQRPVGPSTVTMISANCTLNRVATRTACQEVSKLSEELERAREAQRLEAEATRMGEELAKPRAEPAASDAQVKVLAEVAGALNHATDGRTIDAFLAVAFAALLELGSGISLFLVTTPWRLTAAPEPWRFWLFGGLKRKVANVMDSRLGYVDAFAAACVTNDERGSLTLAQLFLAYQVWCKKRGDVPYDKANFALRFEECATSCGMPFKGDMAHRVYLNVAFLEKERRPRRFA